MNNITLEEKYILEYIKTILHDMKGKSQSIENAKYHHNTAYCDAASICRYGILTLTDLKKQGIKDYSEEFIKRMDDITSHINGNDKVSLSISGLTDLYYDEIEYNSSNPQLVDFLVSNNVKAGRSSEHYGNEFLANGSISNDNLRSADIRLLNIIALIEQRCTLKTYSISELIEKFNYLKDIAIAIKTSNLDIPIREMSYNDQYSLNLDKLSKTPTLILKK